jgi:hypothetical protein
VVLIIQNNEIAIPGVEAEEKPQGIAPKQGVEELFESNPELANAVYEALGVGNLITPNDKIIWGHPAIGKSYAAKKVKMIDFDSYKIGINRKYNLYIAPGLSDTELRTDDKTREARENWRYEKPENAELWNQFIRDAWQQAKKDAKEQGAILFASDLLVLREFGNEVDKALTMPDELFFERSKQRNNFIEGELGTKVWKGNLNKAVNNFKEKFGESKVINTEKYLSDLFITPEQKQQALQLYSQYLDTIFPNSKVKDIVWRADKRINLTPQTTVDDYTQVYVNGVYYSSEIQYSKNYNKVIGGKIYPTILNIKNPAEIKSKHDIERLGRNKKEFERINAINYKENPKDSLIFDNSIYKTEDKYGEVGREIVVFEPEQIHILGSKQDIEGFKKWKKDNTKTVRKGAIVPSIKGHAQFSY